jgi:hypothetical protein
VAIGEADPIRRRTFLAAHFEDLADRLVETNRAAVDVQPVAYCRVHLQHLRCVTA